MPRRAERPAFGLGEAEIAAGTRRTVDLPVSVLSDHTPVTLSIHVVHGRRDGPTLFVSSGIHGDEVIGVEIVRRLLRVPALDRLRGTLMAVPIVNTFGFLNRSRYLPDRRDLNRSFPGAPGGSLGARLANRFLESVVARADLGIDLHSAAIHRTNLPQIRVSPRAPEALRLARVFGAPVILTSTVREGSLRAAAGERGIDVLLYEAGEGLRFDEVAVRAGVAGILRVMRALGMLPARAVARPNARPLIATSSRWIRAPAGGVLRGFRAEGAAVRAGETLAAVSDPFGEAETVVTAPSDGVLIGRTVLPVVNEGDALYHLAAVADHEAADTAVDDLIAQLEADPLFDEDEII